MRVIRGQGSTAKVEADGKAIAVTMDNVTFEMKIADDLDALIKAIPQTTTIAVLVWPCKINKPVIYICRPDTEQKTYDVRNALGHYNDIKSAAPENKQESKIYYSLEQVDEKLDQITVQKRFKALAAMQMAHSNKTFNSPNKIFQNLFFCIESRSDYQAVMDCLAVIKGLYDDKVDIKFRAFLTESLVVVFDYLFALDDKYREQYEKFYESLIAQLVKFSQSNQTSLKPFYDKSQANSGHQLGYKQLKSDGNEQLEDYERCSCLPSCCTQ